MAEASRRHVADLLTLAGLALRPATQEDERLIHLDWTRSGERPFLLGAYQPFKHLADTIAEAKANRNVLMLRALYRREIPQVIDAHGQALMVYDCDNPSFYVGWGCREYLFVKHTFRGQGIASTLRRSLE
jgi:hypothetical protein